jgi:NAD(P)H-hydrate epimerase
VLLICVPAEGDRRLEFANLSRSAHGVVSLRQTVVHEQTWNVVMVDAHALLTVGQMAQADAAAIGAGTSGWQLMQNAGRAVAQAVWQRWSARPVLVLCGPGNNGGDGWVVATYLRDAGWPVTVASLLPPAQLRGDAGLAQATWTGPVVLLDDQTDVAALVAPAELVVDALFGAGLSRPLDGVAQAVLQAVQASGSPVVAVDVPSGVWGDTGQAQGAVPCALTVTFYRLKPAHLMCPSRALCGEVVLVDIGMPPDLRLPDPIHAWENVPALWRDAWPDTAVQAHKYQRGHALVWGSAVMTGAARLAARAAARVGAGLTTVCTPEAGWPIYAASLNSIMVQALPDADEYALTQAWAGVLADARHRAVLIGPGAAGGSNLAVVKALSLVALRSGRAVVLDADAISAWQGDLLGLRSAIEAHPNRSVVITPHEGEFQRLWGGDGSPSGVDRLTRARDAAGACGAVVVLKGADTIVAAPDGRASINQHASAALATAGSGDVLAGLVLGLLAQAVPAWEAASAAVWMHGDAALAFGPGLIADDLPELMPGVLQRLGRVA